MPNNINDKENCFSFVKQQWDFELISPPKNERRSRWMGWDGCIDRIRDESMNELMNELFIYISFQ